MRISDWSSDVCSSDLRAQPRALLGPTVAALPLSNAAHHLVGAGSITRKPPAPISLTSSARSAMPRLLKRKMPSIPPNPSAASRRLVGKLLPGFQSRAMRTVSNTESRSEEHTSELQSLMRISYAVFCLKKKKQQL